MSDAPLTAIVLAAGRGTRLGADVPKCLVPIAGRPLLARYLEALTGLAAPVRLVIGHHADEVATAARELSPEGVELIMNPDYHMGSVISLAAGLLGVRGAALIMDGDVLFDVRVLRTLLDEAGDNGLAIDGTHQFTGEEYMAAVSEDGRVQTLARREVAGHITGEWVGFARLGSEAVSALQHTLTSQIGAGLTGGGYEDALASLLPAFDVRCARVDGMEWTEIDFPEDVREATRIAHALSSGQY